MYARAIVVCSTILLISTLGYPAGDPTDSTREFSEHLDALLPALLDKHHVVGASVALVQDGEVTFTHGYGYADDGTKNKVAAVTLFNVGSISKTVTAWGILKLVEQRRIDLDAPVNKYLKRWHVTSSQFDPNEVTVRRILSHTAGFSMPSVPEYPETERLPTLVDALSDSEKGVKLISKPGTAYNYSGGGYMVLQLLIEDVTGRPFADYMKKEILDPLGMKRSTLEVNRTRSKDMSVPYDSGKRTQYFQYVGEAAASLYSTAEDLGRFAAASLGSARHPAGGGVLRPATVSMMESPALAADGQYGIRSGLGYELWPMGNRIDGELSAGHQGQNTGWSAVLWTRPSSKDGIVLLTNDSNGAALYSVPMCDWADYIKGPSFGRFCPKRSDEPGGTLHRVVPTSEFLESLLEPKFNSTGPGVVVAVSKDSRLIDQASYGLANLDKKIPLGLGTPFYIASLSKPFTAAAALQLVERGQIKMDDRLDKYVPTLPSWSSRVTIQELLTHTSGIPDYYSLIDWRGAHEINNVEVLKLLGGVKDLKFEPGTGFEYSNSGYVLLALVVERVTGESFKSYLMKNVLDPVHMTHTIVFDDARLTLPGNRATGYRRSPKETLLDDFDVFQDDNGHTYQLKFTTTGAGGLFSTAEDLLRWDRALSTTTVLSTPMLTLSFSPQVKASGIESIPNLSGGGLGWFISDRNGNQVIWQDGAKGGFKSLLVRVPKYHFAAVLLSNSADSDLRGLAMQIMDHYLASSEVSQHRSGAEPRTRLPSRHESAPQNWYFPTII